MKENGIVSSIRGSIAEVIIKEGEACAKCRMCLFKPDGTMSIMAANDAGAKIGDTVEVEVPGQKVVISSLVLFIFPIICFFSAYILMGIDFAFLCLLTYSILVYFIDKKFVSNARISRLLS